MALLFTVTLLLSAFLLFWVQPLVGKLLLPLLGGTPAVWNTCMLFFQGMLLAGYAYVNALTRLRQSRQVVVHAALLALAAFFFPIGISEATARGVPEGGIPALWLLGRLFLMVGLPFFAVSTSAPLLQKWFSRTRHASADDPYFLYAASNMGSFFALLGFPLLVEPNWTLGAQGRYWAWGYGVLALLILACAFASRRGGETAEASNTTGESVDGGDAGRKVDGGAAVGDEAEAVSWRRRLRWTLLAFVPSSLVLGVTTYITTDVAAVPLLWVIPLSIYLLTFVLVFAKRQIVPWGWMATILPGSALLLALIYLSGATEPVWFLVLVHLLFLFVASMVCHGQLAADRPDARHLAEFYLWVAVGGVLGGFFNAIVAPLVFDAVAEYPLMVVLACALRPTPSRRTLVITRKGIKVKEAPPDETKVVDQAAARRKDLLFPLAVGVLTAVLVVYVPRLGLKPVEDAAIMYGVPLLLLNHFFARRPVRFALGLGAVMLAVVFLSGTRARTLHAERNFYGTLRVVEDSTSDMRRLLHGSTLHGRQWTDEERRCEPLSYYHVTGPLGAVIETYRARPASPNVAAVGLGAGASVAHARPGERWTFYEIDPAVDDIARDPNYFTYLTYCSAAPNRTVLGDARLKLRDAPDGHYGLIILDAFSSDAIPAHLLTREALRLYLSKLAPGGLIAFHVSNRALNLDAVVGGLARDAGLEARIFNDHDYRPEIGKEPSHWAVLVRRPEDLGPLAADA
ncbi:MAG TPA: fused MFS/spermidine synthase, partial [Pyrinomonadaceae bacterium]|nr:fused MFS/spermidine synthase [Pyrinomonadaceae bacterium]